MRRILQNCIDGDDNAKTGNTVSLLLRSLRSQGLIEWPILSVTFFAAFRRSSGGYFLLLTGVH